MYFQYEDFRIFSSFSEDYIHAIIYLGNVYVYQLFVVNILFFEYLPEYLSSY